MFVADSKANEVRAYRLSEDGSVAASEIFAGNLHQPYGIAFYPLSDPEWVYIANSHSVVRLPYKKGDLKARGQSELIIDHIPAAHHWTRDIAFSPDGKVLYLAVGSGSNVALDMSPEPRDGGLKSGTRRIPLAQPGTRKSAAPLCWPSIPMERTRGLSPPGCATAQVSPYSRARTICGAR